MRLILLAMTMLTSAAPASAEQFDLVCSFGKTPIRYRVDLTRGEACQGQCDRVWKIGAVTTGEIRLMDTPTNYPDELPQTMTINRQTGVLDHWIGGASGAITERASCEPAAFSGFPAAKF